MDSMPFQSPQACMTPQPRIWLRAAAVLFLLLGLACPVMARQAIEQDRATFERWFIVNLEGQRAGYLHAQERVEDGQLVDATQMKLEIRRGPVSLLIEMGTRFVETPEGRPIESFNTQKISQMATTTALRFSPDKVTIITEQGSQRTVSEVTPSKQPWMTPRALARHIESELAKGSKTIKAWSLEASLGHEPSETTLTVVGKETIAVMGRRVEATVLQSVNSRMPGVVSTIYADAQGRPLKMNMGVGGINLEIIEASQAVALTPVDPPQLLASMLITPKGTIDGPRTLRQGIYELRIGTMEDGSPVPLPETFLPRGGYQRVVWSDASTARVVIDLDQPVEAGKDLPTEGDRNASPLVDINDAVVKQRALQALAGLPEDATSVQKAEAIRRYVYRYIRKKDLSVGFASASETARTGQGDCTEHAVLLTALLRSQGIAARTVSGLVYADQFEGHEAIFGYHMWTRAWLPAADGAGSTWIDLDATLDLNQPLDATHIALGTSDLSKGMLANDMVVLAPVLGRLRIEVVD